MKEFYGVMLLDTKEVVLRIYQTNGTDWQLLHYSSKDIPVETQSSLDVSLITIITSFMAESYTQQIIDWRICSKNLSQQTITTVAQATGFTIEAISPHREQELICKGMFTELW